MNSTVVRNALGSLEKVLSDAKRALSDVEKDKFSGYGDPSGGFENPSAAMGAFLEELHDVLLVVLEAAEMPATRASLLEAWPKFTSGKGLSHTIDYPEFLSCESPALTFIERLMQGLRIAVSDSMSSEEAWTLSMVEGMLRDTAKLVRGREKPPANELDLQKIMHDYRGACFPDFTPTPHIGGTLKTFKPDCGIRSVGAAIEFKFVRKKEEVAIAFSGIAEDSAGYKGSKDWTRFYTVIYQAEPFASESQLRSDLKRIGAATWTPFVVNGPVDNVEKSKKAKQKAKAT